MDSLKDLTNFLKTQSFGASFSELKAVFNDEGELRSFIKIGLENGVINKEGEKRGTRYFVGTLSEKVTKEETTFEQATTDMEVFLKSDKPCLGQPYFSTVERFGEDDKTISKFLASGVKITQTTLMYNKAAKRNEIISQKVNYHYNQISLSQEGRSFIFTKFYAENCKQKKEVFGDYDDFREFIRVSLT